jgi:heat-inducible transcriptional repressor
MLDGRNKEVLLAVIESYIDSPDPVGSRYVTKKYGFGLSPATIRNIMADLEDMGFLMQPHTSAGRVPTDLGYRFYVEHILDPYDVQRAAFSDDMLTHLNCLSGDVDCMLQETTKIISQFSHYLGIASLPSTESSTFHKIELLSYKDDRIVVMLFTNEGMIKHKIITNDLMLKQSDMNRIASYLNSRFSGMNIGEIRVQLVQEIKEQKDECDTLISKALDLFGSQSDGSGDDVLVSGFKEVVNLPDFSDIEKIKKLSEAIENKHMIVKLIDRIVKEDDIQIVIGAENRIEGLDDMSLVATTYKDDGRPVGVIGIIGPTRMNYNNAIAVVDTAAKYLGHILKAR